MQHMGVFTLPQQSWSSVRQQQGSLRSRKDASSSLGHCHAGMLTPGLGEDLEKTWRSGMDLDLLPVGVTEEMDCQRSFELVNLIVSPLGGPFPEKNICSLISIFLVTDT